ncbi:MAG: Holliday junction resolvase RuvX [Clostridia bacterium]|nr:Holliday junction resolvase RuvX [Clostridia bacterium]
MIILGIDYGEKNTGIAITDKSQILAYPLTTIRTENYRELIKEIIKIVNDNSVDEIVIGFPKNMDGTIGEKAKKTQKLRADLQKEVAIPIELFDERLTTVIGYKKLHSGNVKKRKKKSVVDKTAATVILSDYLKYKENKIESK